MNLGIDTWTEKEGFKRNRKKTFLAKFLDVDFVD